MEVTRLLLVDDEPLILATFKRGLRAHGYCVAIADGAESALACTAGQPFDLAILDIRMPGLSGLELGRMLRERHGLPCVYLTAIGDASFIARAAQDGALTYLVKPVDVAQVIPVIEMALARSRDIKALAQQKDNLDLALSGKRHTSMAIGILMERHRITEQRAFELLRAEARRQRRNIDDYCGEWISCQ